MAFTTIKGRYCNGQIELEELPQKKEAEVLVTFLEDVSSEQDRDARVAEFLAGMRQDYRLGGGSYPEREEIYCERLKE